MPEALPWDVRSMSAPAFLRWFQWSSLREMLEVMILALVAIWYAMQRKIKAEAGEESSFGMNEEDALMKRHSKQMMQHFKFASVIMEYKSARVNAGLSAPDLPADVPQFLLLGNQSSGKTTILQRLTKLPLGVTGTTQGTCRPFQFTLIHDPNEESHVIQVDSEDVAVENLLQKLQAKNVENGGAFDPRRVSVTIRSKHVTSLIIVDMPGLSSLSDEPRRMALRELEDPSAIPILVLPCTDPRSADSARTAFESLLDGRDTRAVAIANKFDEKILEAASELGSGTKWNQWVESWNHQTPQQKARYAAWFMVGVPPGNPNDDLVSRLKQSGSKEERLIQQWKQRCGPDAIWPEPIRFGLAAFEEFVHKQQSERLSAFVASLRPRLGQLRSSEQELIPPKHQGFSLLLKQLAFIVTEGQTIWEGRLSSGLYSENVKKTLQEEVDWLKQQNMGERAHVMIDMLETGNWQAAVGPAAGASTDAGTDSESERAAATRRRCLQCWLLESVYASETHLLGLAATNRFAHCIERFAFGCLWLHTTANYDLEFFRNSVSDQQHQTANNAIKEYKKAMCARVFRPLAELMRIMLQEQFVRSMEAPFDSEQRDLKPWFHALQTENLHVGEIRSAYLPEALASVVAELQVRDIANMCGEEFGKMMGNDIETLESELLHSFSDDDSARFIRKNEVLGDSANLERRGGVPHYYSREALARRFLGTFAKQVKQTSAPHMESLRNDAENVLNHGTIAMSLQAGAHEVAEFFHSLDGTEPHVISEKDCRCISSADSWSSLFSGHSSWTQDFRSLHLISGKINSATFCQVEMEIFGHTEWWLGMFGTHLPTRKEQLGQRQLGYCGVVLQEEESGKIISTRAAKPCWTEVRFEIPHSSEPKNYIIHILDYQPRGIACRRLNCLQREFDMPSSSADQPAPTLTVSVESDSSQAGSETSEALAKIMHSEVAIQVDSHPQNDHEETMFHELHSRISMEMTSTLKQFHSDLHKNINKFREMSIGRSPYFIAGLGRSLEGIKEEQERLSRLQIAQVCHRLILIERASSIAESGTI